MGLSNTIVAKNAGLISTITPKSNSSIVLNGNNVLETVIKSPALVTTINIGIRGPRGADGSAFLYKNASSIVGGHRVIRSSNANEVEHADSHNLFHGDDTLGLSLNAAIIGGEVQIAPSGQFVVNVGWSWLPLNPIYLSSDGLLTQTPPSTLTGDLFHQTVGYAESATQMFVSITPAIYFN